MPATISYFENIVSEKCQLKRSESLGQPSPDCRLRNEDLRKALEIVAQSN